MNALNLAREARLWLGLWLLLRGKPVKVSCLERGFFGFSFEGETEHEPTGETFCGL